MPDPLSRALLRAGYLASQLPRLAWYGGHKYAVRQLEQLARRIDDEPKEPRPHTDRPTPDRQRLYADMRRLFVQDLANVEAGLYPVPADHDGSVLSVLRNSALFFADLPEIHRRRSNNGHSEVLSAETLGKRPRYYLQNFHFQTGGWLTDDSAQRYDTQVEVLFNGTANAMRRQALPPIRECITGRDQRRLRLLDVGCGTGRFLDFVKQAWPRLPCIGLDMSDAYVRHARSHLAGRRGLAFVVGDAERIPLNDESQDAVTSTFVLHELPAKVRRRVFAETSRVLKPGGRLVAVDSLQRGDAPDYDGLLELFSQRYHEPYFLSYIDDDFAAVARDCGLVPASETIAFLSKVMVFDKPPASA